MIKWNANEYLVAVYERVDIPSMLFLKEESEAFSQQDWAYTFDNFNVDFELFCRFATQTFFQIFFHLVFENVVCSSTFRFFLLFYIFLSFLLLSSYIYIYMWFYVDPIADADSATVRLGAL